MMTNLRHASPPRPSLGRRLMAGLLSFSLVAPAWAATPLADQPIPSNVKVAGNLALPLSVEFPTAISVAHVDNTYLPTNEYLGYFDPNKCYLYKTYTVETATDKDHFYPAALTSNRTCTGSNDQMWSGNFLNWATMQTIDPFRWALTGGYRVVDTPSLTILEKAYASAQGGDANFPNRTVTDTAVIAGATPFTTSYVSRVKSAGERMLLVPDGVGSGLLGTYFNNRTLSGNPVLTRFDTVDFNWGTGSPGTGVTTDNFSARWTVTTVAPSTGTYNFQTVSDDGVRLYVNGVLVIDNWTDHAPTTNTSNNLSYTAGETLKITLEYYEAGGGTEIRLRWKPPGATGYTTYVPTPDSLNNVTPPYPQYMIRVRVCDPNVTSTVGQGLESNCVAYANGNYKPEGLMQKYNKQIRYSVFGYLNDDNIQRDGGVLRAQQKFVGPKYPVPGSDDVTNGAAEWSATTGVFVTNPDGITSALGQTIADSGALNYVNKFGEVLRGKYKTYDPVGELYYAALRYYKNLGNISTWTAASTDANTNKVWADGFPVITSWDDPIQYSCQRNFILGIGDVNSHADKNVPGGTGTANEPAKPGGLADDPFNAQTATNKVGVMQGLGTSLGTTENYNGCCNNNSALMAGLAYDANTQDIRPDNVSVPRTKGKQTVQTYWMDVQEYQTYKANNQYYLAAKYGGFTVPDDYDLNRTDPLVESWWHTASPNAADNTVGSGNAAQLRPNNFYTASKPEQVVKGLTAAFADIASKSSAYSSALGTAQPQVSTSGNASFSANYDSSRWSGDVIASSLSFDADGNPSLSEQWRFASRLAVQATGTGWDAARRIVTWDGSDGAPFRLDSLSTAQKALLNTSYISGDDSANYLNYLRGDRSKEVTAGATDAARVYRQRQSLVGDINGSRVTVVAGPSLNLSDSTNTGYSSFKTGKASRKRMIYVGANDGMLHAIDGALTSTESSTYGQEMFAYVPSALYAGPSGAANTDGLAALGNPSYTHRNYVNATPYAMDVDFGNTEGGSGTDWRTILIGGLGKGGKSYYAIDITNPGDITSTTAETTVAGKVLWEFTDADMGFSFGDPVVVKTAKYGWVVVLTSGYNNADGEGYFFIVNPRTGELLEKIGTGEGATDNDAGLAHATAYVLDRTDGTADAIYAGDLLGNVWRLDVTGDDAYAAPTKIAVLTSSSGSAQPVTSRPIVSIDPDTRKRHMMIGTGRYLETSDIKATQPQNFYAIEDGNTVRFNKSANLPTGVTFPLERSDLAQLSDLTAGVTLTSTQMGWYYNLGVGSNGSGKRVVSSPTTFLGTVAFAAFLPDASDPCSPGGSSEIYAMNFGSGKTQLVDGDNNAISSYSFDGQVTDLVFLSVDGKLQLLGGNDKGELKPIPTKPLGSALKKLNWREITVAQ